MEGSVFKVCARIVDEEVTIADGVSASVNALAMEGTATGKYRIIQKWPVYTVYTYKYDCFVQER